MNAPDITSKRFTDIFINRPVLAIVVSMMILVLGLRSVFHLPVRQFPRTENAVITVMTTYYGANSDVIAGFITTPLENAIAQVNGIDYMASQSRNSLSTITVYLRLNYDPDKALTEVQTKISSVLNQLPPQTQQPVLSIKVGQPYDDMYIGFGSDILPPNKITDFIIRVAQPRLQSVEGVQTAELIGNKNIALRAWLDPAKLAAYNLTAADVSSALARNNYISGIGTTKGQMVQVNLTASTDLHSLDEFRNLVVKESGGALVRLQDIANVTLGSEDYDQQVTFDGKKAIYIGIQAAPNANLLNVMDGVRKEFKELSSQLPQGLHSEVVYDSTKFVQSAIDEVIHTLIEALLIVILVVFAFLGSPRSVVIPVIAIPLSLVGATIFMVMYGFSINLLTLLALVLGIGLVVDDAIIIVENVNRHIEEGMRPFDAAIQGARELIGPIIAMTIVLIAVYIPIGFGGGLTGALFTEFAFSLVFAVTISAVVALTLSPMLCAYFLKPKEAKKPQWEEKLLAFIENTFARLHTYYERMLDRSLNFLPVTGMFAVFIVICIVVLWTNSKDELAPQEDQGVLFAIVTAAPNSTLDQRQIYAHKGYETLSGYPETEHVFQLDIPGAFFEGAVLKPWEERKRTTGMLLPTFQHDLDGISGIRNAVVSPNPLPGGGGNFPIDFAIQSTASFNEINEVAQKIMAEAMETHKFWYLDLDMKIDLPQATIEIDRDKAAQLGLSMNDVGGALSTMLGGGYVNYFNLDGRSYKVIPQVQQRSRLNANQLNDYYVHAKDGSTVPLSTIAHITTKTVPESLNHFQQLNAATLHAVPGVPMGEALDTLREIAKKNMPLGYSLDYGSEARQYVQESGGFLPTLGFAVIIIFLTLAAQYESFRDPVIILFSVPMSVTGALIFISMGIGESSINIYTKIGIFTLMGLISKHGILIVEFANRMQEEGMTKRQAIEHACGIRLRPILMTTAAMVLGVVPLLISSGAGAASRFNMGLVIASGLTIGTLFTLFVVPAFYMLIGADHHKKTTGVRSEVPAV